ncbi:group II intron reverse transcriptase/maturase [Gloeothece verrucosa]|uniref:group II intron reverse transcriptase/maturase n=1 Tax=Gloeothece verrucosa TaxID=2546359 RepID=UPI0002F5F718|nr:group II intron reverse transcriptase/maturase [Gloeothece verrucosa]
MDSANKLKYEWETIPWRKLEVQVFKLQKRIYRAGQSGNVVLVRKLQRLLMKSLAAKLLAVRRVTQDNRGKRTAGIDGVKSLTPKQRLVLAENLNLSDKSTPIRRVYIPKPNKKELRPLGIPTMTERAKQALVKLALEPEWEARFEPHSYGFRPSRSAHDAIAYIKIDIQRLDKYVLDADISKCFDKINHSALLTKLNTFPKMRRQIKAWLKAGIMDGNKLFPSEEGTPQGGVISPLLANIALHGLEEYLTSHVPKTAYINKKVTNWKLTVVRYADDFLILHRDLNELLRIKALAEKWLSNMGLELNPNKTQIVHTFNSHEGKQAGFNFLGFHIRHYPAGIRDRRYKSGGCNQGGHRWTQIVPYVVLIKPSAEAIKQHKRKLSQVIDGLKTAPQSRLIRELNPIIRGWANYYSSVNSKETFSDIDHWLWIKLRRWCLRRHPMKPDKWVYNKYWHVDERHKGKKWDFNDGELSLTEHRQTPINRHINVKGDRSPYDGDWIYWSTRLGKYPNIRSPITKLLKTQKGKCSKCQLYFSLEDILEIHHIDENRNNNRLTNLTVLHGHCHDNIHR